MEQAAQTRITIPPSPRNQSVIVAAAATDPELHAAMIADGWTTLPDIKTKGAAPCERNPIKTDANDKAMTDQTGRSELNATLSAIEDRMDKRIERMEKAEDRRAEAYRREQEARDKLYIERFEAMHRRLEDQDKVIDSKLDAMSESISRVGATVNGFEKQLDEKLKEVKSSNRNAGWAMLAIAAATVVGIWGANSTIVGSAAGIFDSGKQQASRDKDAQEILQELKAQSADTRNLLEQLKAQQAVPQTTPPAKQ